MAVVLGGSGILPSHIECVSLGAKRPRATFAVIELVCDCKSGIGEAQSPLHVDSNFSENLLGNGSDHVRLDQRTMTCEKRFASDLIADLGQLLQQFLFCVCPVRHCHWKPRRCRRSRSFLRHRPRMNPMDPVAIPNSRATSV